MRAKGPIESDSSADYHVKSVESQPRSVCTTHTDEEVVPTHNQVVDRNISFTTTMRGETKESLVPTEAGPEDSQEFQTEFHTSYHTEGVAQCVARSHIFINLMHFCIIANAIYLGFDIDLNRGTSALDTSWFFIIMDNIFCMIFFLEVLIRFAAFRIKLDCLYDHWFRFDLFLVCFMVLETWILPLVTTIFPGDLVSLNFGPLRLLRLMRLTRMTRLMKHMPELVAMTHGLLAGMRASFSAIFLNCILIYTFACGMVILLKDEAEANEVMKRLSYSEDMNCEHMVNSMWFLMVDGTFLLDGTGSVLSSLVFSDSVSTYLAG